MESVLAAQGYWSGMSYRYYLNGDDWRAEQRFIATGYYVEEGEDE